MGRFEINSTRPILLFQFFNINIVTTRYAIKARKHMTVIESRESVSYFFLRDI